MRTCSQLRRIVLAYLVFCGTQLVFAASFDPTTFQAPDGSMALNPAGDYVEPYFATKALIVAQDGGLDVHEAALAWIDWALPRQRPNGLFRRYCRRDGEWKDCAPADADDSMLALWMQLLYRMAPSSGMPTGWRRSVAVSQRQLEMLRNRRLGVYHVSQRNHVALLMDNVEVYAALKDVARVQLQLNDPSGKTTEEQANQLGIDIQRVFWSRRANRFRPSMQKTRPAFYPDVVAQVYPWLAGMSGPGMDARQSWKQWKRSFGTAWIERRYDSHPWGLVALAAEELGDNSTAACWTSQSDPLRGSDSWNVLEEAVWQSLRAQLSQVQLLNPNSCNGLLASR